MKYLIDEVVKAARTVRTDWGNEPYIFDIDDLWSAVDALKEADYEFYVLPEEENNDRLKALVVREAYEVYRNLGDTVISFERLFEAVAFLDDGI